MRSILTLLVLLFSCSAVFAGPSVYEKLSEINKCWKEQRDIDRSKLQGQQNLSEPELIRLHLTLVEHTLRNRSTSHLTPAQRLKRTVALNHLHEYLNAGAFPQNEDYAYRTPIFIDKYDNFCAVGYLVKATGYEDVSRMIAANTNLAYVREMKYPELFGWANEYGFTVDELAWIQPAYYIPPTRVTDPIGKGTDGEVAELYVDPTTDRLYVGGTFTNVDSTMTANNIAYVTEAGGVFTWHTMGTGVNGRVNAIVRHDNKIFVAGSFSQAGGVNVTNVAYWDGTAWHDAGCTYGTVSDLVVFNGELYAVGDFDVCAAMMEVNFAKWDPAFNMWQQIFGLTGHVNTIEVRDSTLLLGGNFTYLSSPKQNVIEWNETIGFRELTNGLANEAMDFQMFRDTMYVACKRTAQNDSNLVQRLVNNTWTPVSAVPNYMSGNPEVSFNTLCAQGDTLMGGGEFLLYGMMTPSITYNLDLTSNSKIRTAFFVDSAINKMVVYKNDLIIGGKFDVGDAHIQHQGSVIHSIAKKSFPGFLGIDDFDKAKLNCAVYPNPVKKANSIYVDNNFRASYCQVVDMSGKLIKEQQLRKESEQVALPSLAAGIYVVEVGNEQGEKVVNKLVVE